MHVSFSIQFNPYFLILVLTRKRGVARLCVLEEEGCRYIFVNYLKACVQKWGKKPRRADIMFSTMCTRIQVINDEKGSKSIHSKTNKDPGVSKTTSRTWAKYNNGVRSRHS